MRQNTRKRKCCEPISLSKSESAFYWIYFLIGYTRPSSCLDITITGRQHHDYRSPRSTLPTQSPPLPPPPSSSASLPSSPPQLKPSRLHHHNQRHHRHHYTIINIIDHHYNHNHHCLSPYYLLVNCYYSLVDATALSCTNWSFLIVIHHKIIST